MNRKKLTALIYMLLRDGLPAGRMEWIVQQIETCNGPITYSNQFLAGYAEELSNRLFEKETNDA